MLTKNVIEQYFTAEKNESLLFIIIGLISISLSIFGYFFYKTQAWKGAAIPLIVIGLIQLAVGYTVYKRSDDDRMRLVYAYDMNPNEIKKSELPRMNIINKNFVTYRLVQLALIVAGFLMIFYNSFFALPEYKQTNDYSFSHGLGIALVIQAIIMLGSDFFAEKRALRYTRELQSFVDNAKLARVQLASKIS
jgi:undecaprenyl pyrophosphate phosphatase UppP